MRLNIKKRGPVVKNLILFVILSGVYLFIIESINAGKTSLDLMALKAFYLNNILLLSLTIINCYFIFIVKNHSKWLLLGYFGWVSFNSFGYFFENFDKLILVYSFIYLLFSGYFYIFWKLELKDVVYSPGFALNQIGLLNKQGLNVDVMFNNVEAKGFLTNIGDNSCFIHIKNKEIQFCKEVKITTELEGREFCSKGEVITSFSSGVGLKLDESFRKKDKRTWKEYYDIIVDRGIYPVLTGTNM